MVYRLGELFCGPGGLALGAKLASANAGNEVYSIEHAWATDWDKDTCETYRLNICPEAADTVIQEDVRTLDFGLLKKISDIDALAFGFPCNDFSIVGEQKGINGSYGPLYTYGLKAIDFFQPKWFLAENVGGLTTANEGKTFTIILQSLFERGYDIFPHLYKFEEYGIPQARHRIIIVGIKKELNRYYRVPSTKLYSKIDNSCKNAIENPPININAPNHEFTKQSPKVIERLKYIKPNENAFTANLPDHLKLNVKGAKISQIYKRLDPSKPAYTVTGSGGGGTHVYHWSEPRSLTNRERARLQTFPDSFIFVGSKESVRKQIGMAVPVIGAKIIFEAILKTLHGISYEYEESNLPYMLHSENLYSVKYDFYNQFYMLEKEREN
jgi:DNA (cytosine-5)-methyltransferase 1